MKHKLFAVLLAALMIVGCSQNQVLASLDASVAAAQLLVNTLPNIPPTVRSAVTVALQPLPEIFAKTTAELSSTDSDAIRAVKIAGYFAPEVAALTVLPPAVKAYTDAVLAAIQAFLSNYPVPMAGARAAASSKRTNFKSDELHKIDAKNQALRKSMGM